MKLFFVAFILILITYYINTCSPPQSSCKSDHDCCQNCGIVNCMNSTCVSKYPCASLGDFCEMDCDCCSLNCVNLNGIWSCD